MASGRQSTHTRSEVKDSSDDGDDDDDDDEEDGDENEEEEKEEAEVEVGDDRGEDDGKLMPCDRSQSLRACQSGIADTPNALPKVSNMDDVTDDDREEDDDMVMDVGNNGSGNVRGGVG
jgi:hypothetical protein